MSASVVSTIAAKQVLALSKGPNSGASNAATAAPLYLFDDVATLPVGAPSIATATDYVRFGKLPAGAKIIPHLSLLTSDHSAAVAGKFYLVPLDGSTVPAALAAIANIDSTEVAVMLDNAEITPLAKDSWLQWVPDADLTIASTAKTLRARIGYSMPY